MRALTFREIKALDTIVLDECIDQDSDIYSVPSDYHMKPFFNEGVIKFTVSMDKDYSYYARINSEGGFIEVYSYNKKNYEFQRLVIANVNDFGELEVLSDFEVEWMKVAPENFPQFLIKVVTSLMAYISYQIESKDTTIVEPKKKRSEGGYEGSTASQKTTYSFINKNKVIYTYTTNGKKRSTYCRKTQSWWVCGHPRHYKNGTVTWVHPYKKGEGVATAKKYLVKKDRMIR